MYAIYFVAHWQLRQASRVVTMSGAKKQRRKNRENFCLFHWLFLIVIINSIILAYVDMMSSSIIMRLQLYNLISY